VSLVFVPGYLSARLYTRPFDPNVRLVDENVGGYHIAVPAWPRFADHEIRSGIGVRQRVTGEVVTFEWHDGGKIDDAIAQMNAVIASHTLTKFADEVGTHAGTPTHALIFGDMNRTAAMTAVACARGVVVIYTSVQSGERDALAAFHARVCASLVCAP
jgi:hypothetical protein